MAATVSFSTMLAGAAALAPYDVKPVGLWEGATVATSVAIFWDNTNGRFVLVTTA